MEPAEIVMLILSTAKKIYDVIEEVQYFEHRRLHLKVYIENLMPPIEKLAISEQRVPDHAKTPEGLKLFSITLGRILQLLERIKNFLESLRNQRFPFIYKLLHKGSIGENFDGYSDQLDTHVKALQFSLAVENREVTYPCFKRIEDDRADQEKDERALIGAYCKGSEKILDEIKKLSQGQEEIKKKLDAAATPDGKNQSAISKLYKVAEGLQKISPDQLRRDNVYSRQASFGEVYSALYKNERVAVKSFDICKDETVEEQLWKEARNLRRLNSLYIVRLWGVWTEESPYLLVFEYMAKGNLREVLTAHGSNMKVLPWTRRIQMALDGARGLYRMHNTDPSPVMHRSLSSDTFFVDDDWKMKISGVGFAATQSSILIKSKPLKVKMGTLNYISPESLANVNYEVDARSDVYSYGVVMWEIATGSKPYENFSSKMIREFVLKKDKLPLSEDCPCNFKTLIDDCRSFSAEARPTAGDIVDRLEKLIVSLQETWC